jgi:hypothetical protein
MLHALNSTASVAAHPDLVDETTYTFASDVPEEEVVVTPCAADDASDDLILEQHVERLRSTLGTDFAVTDRYERTFAFGRAVGIEHRTTFLGTTVTGQLAVVTAGSVMAICSIGGPHNRELLEQLLLSVASIEWAGCPTRESSFRAFAGSVSFELPARFMEPAAFVFGLGDQHFTIELGDRAPPAPETVVYSDADHPPRVGRLPPVTIADGIALDRWTLEVRQVGEPRSFRYATMQRRGGTIWAWGPKEEASGIESISGFLASTLVVTERG